MIFALNFLIRRFWCMNFIYSLCKSMFYGQVKRFIQWIALFIIWASGARFNLQQNFQFLFRFKPTPLRKMFVTLCRRLYHNRVMSFYILFHQGPIKTLKNIPTKAVNKTNDSCVDCPLMFDDTRWLCLCCCCFVIFILPLLIRDHTPLMMESRHL